MRTLLSTLPPREQRGSRARCVLMTDGPNMVVAKRLTRLVEPFARVDPARDAWMPRGLTAPAEARLGEATRLLPSGHREILTDWWLAVRGRANTPNWDITATATIEGRKGLVLVEAKAHSRELKEDGMGAGNERNRERIRAAVLDAHQALNASGSGWALSCDSRYQLANRFAWSWKLASLGVPVVLVYLGFLNAEEIRDRGEPFAHTGAWDQAVRAHANGIVPGNAWEQRLDVEGTPVVPLIRSLDLPLDPEMEA
jgi:hypothetical protein